MLPSFDWVSTGPIPRSLLLPLNVVIYWVLAKEQETYCSEAGIAASSFAGTGVFVRFWCFLAVKRRLIRLRTLPTQRQGPDMMDLICSVLEIVAEEIQLKRCG